MQTQRCESSSHPKVLVVEDDEEIRSLYCHHLRLDKVDCVPAGSVNEAISALQNVGHISLVLLDWGLRGSADASGLEVLRFCRAKYPLMPVIVISGQTTDIRTDCLELADCFLSKPLSATVLRRQVARWLERLRGTPTPFLPLQEKEIRSLEDVKRDYILHVFRLLDGNAALAATRLGIHRQTVAKVLGEGSSSNSSESTNRERR